jgi:hypothetical protein
VTGERTGCRRIRPVLAKLEPSGHLHAVGHTGDGAALCSTTPTPVSRHHPSISSTSGAVVVFALPHPRVYTPVVRAVVPAATRGTGGEDRVRTAKEAERAASRGAGQARGRDDAAAVAVDALCGCHPLSCLPTDLACGGRRWSTHAPLGRR